MDGWCVGRSFNKSDTLNALKVEACGANKPTSGTDHAAHTGADWGVDGGGGGGGFTRSLIQVKNDFICSQLYRLHLWPALAPQTHLEKRPIIWPPQHGDRPGGGGVREEGDATYGRHGYGSLDIYWSFRGAWFISPTWMSVVAPVVAVCFDDALRQRSAVDAHWILLYKNND